MKAGKVLLLGTFLGLIGICSVSAIQTDVEVDAISQATDTSPANGETITINGKEVHTIGKMIRKGKNAPDFTAVKSDLTESSLLDYKGKKIVLNIFPSLDTPICATSVRKFNEMASKLNNTVVLCLSKDLPFAMSRFCTTEGLKNVVPLSLYRSKDFPKKYRMIMADGPLKGLTPRAVIIISEKGEIVYTELVKELKTEPDYEAALQALK